MEATIIQMRPMHMRSSYINSDEPKKLTEMKDFVQDEMDKPHRNESFKRNYGNLVLKLKEFEAHIGEPIFTQSVTEDFMRDFDRFLKSQNLRPNTIVSILTALKTMCKKAGNYGYRVSNTYDDYSRKGEPSTGIALTLSEVTRIFYYENLTLKQKAIRDLFVIGCLTGLRFSDYSRLTANDIQNGIITIKTQKTGVVVHIPVHPFVREAISRHNGKFPATGISMSYFNRYVKMICRKVGLTEIISRIREKGETATNEQKPKYKLIASHTARRTFATLLYSSGKFTTAQIMLITGHKSEVSFFKYIRIDPQENANAVSGSFSMIL